MSLYLSRNLQFFSPSIAEWLNQSSSTSVRDQNRLQFGLAPTRSQAGSRPNPDQNPGWPTRVLTRVGSWVGLDPGWPTRPQAGSIPDPARGRVDTNPAWSRAGDQTGLGSGWRQPDLDLGRAPTRPGTGLLAPTRTGVGLGAKPASGRVGQPGLDPGRRPDPGWGWVGSWSVIANPSSEKNEKTQHACQQTSFRAHKSMSIV